MWSISRTFPVASIADDALPLFVRIADAIIDDIRRGTLRAGDRLPSTRGLARQLRVNRNTIVAAFDELVAQGWVVSRGAAGTFVSAEVPDRPVRVPKAPPAGTRAGFAIRTVPPLRTPIGDGTAKYLLSAGVPDTRLLPRAALSRAYRRALRSKQLDYGDAQGVLRLRDAIAGMLRTARGMSVGPENILVTRGSQMAIDLAARLVLRPGDTAAVEELGYQPAWRAFEEAGARLAPIALDDSGLVVDALARERRARLVYVTPHHQYPTTVLMSPARRAALLDLARARDLAIVEDDYDHEFHFDGRPVAPLAAHDRHRSVIYVGTLSKILAPGLRLGYAVAAEPVIAAMTRLRALVDRQGDHVLEHAVAELVEDGEIQRHARKMRRIYTARRDALVAAIERDLRGVLTFSLPAGGLTLWARVGDDVPLDAWCRAALSRGVSLATARDFDLDRRTRPFVRLVFAHYDESELADAVRRMRRALDAL